MWGWNSQSRHQESHVPPTACQGLLIFILMCIFDLALLPPRKENFFCFCFRFVGWGGEEPFFFCVKHRFTYSTWRYAVYCGSNISWEMIRKNVIKRLLEEAVRKKRLRNTDLETTFSHLHIYGTRMDLKIVSVS